jgi:hypothetical protein
MKVIKLDAILKEFNGVMDLYEESNEVYRVLKRMKRVMENNYSLEVSDVNNDA